jgi:two-component system sensor histidine kinase DevS
MHQPRARLARTAALMLWVRRWRLSPGTIIAIVAYVMVAVFGAALAAALLIPAYGARFVPQGEAIVPILNGQPYPALTGTTPITIANRSAQITVPAATLVPDDMAPGTPAQIRGWYRDRSRIAEVACGEAATISFRSATGAVSAPLAPQRRGIVDLRLDFWLLTLEAVLVGILGLWVRANRPRELSSWLFGASCDGILLAAMSGAVFDSRELTADGTLLQVMAGLNYTGSNLASFGLTALFLVVPTRLAGTRITLALLAIALVLGVIEGLGLVSLRAFYVGLLPNVVAFPLIVAAQWRATRRDPAGRMLLRWVGVTVLLSSSLLGLGMAAPVLFGVPPLASDGFSIVPMAITYGGIALGVGRVRMFELDQWSYRLLLGAVAIIVLLGIDAAAIYLLDTAAPVALAIALLVAGYLYMPLRSRLWAAISGGRPVSRDALFRHAALVAFGPTSTARRADWRALLDRMFEPLEIASATRPVGRAELAGRGEFLLIPATSDDVALQLRFARRGRRTFGSADLATARELIVLIEEAETARAAYTRGVTDERQRIARDLHDDVSSLLLTGLHRRDVDEVRGDVRRALGEIRTMVTSLTGPARPLTETLADLRYECAGRLHNHGIALDWPLAADNDIDTAELDYARHKAITSTVREAISNVIRHANATRVRVSVTVDAAALAIAIDDDGHGRPAAAIPATGGGGNGLGNLVARVSEIGGECHYLHLAPGFGVRLSIPLAGGETSSLP